MLYLLDEPMAEIGLRTIAADEDPTVVLIQDGVLLEPDLDAPTYAVEADVDVRGVDLPDGIEPITYAEVVDLLGTKEVRSFV